MPRQGKKRLERIVRSTLNEKQDKLKLVPALLGAYVNGQKTLPVSGRSDFVWCRIRGATSEVVQAFNDTVAEHFDLPVLIYRDPNHEGLWRVHGRDITQYEDWEGVSYIPSHGATHSFVGGVGSGNDPVWVYKRQFMPLLPRPVVSGTMSIYVEQDIYYWDGSFQWWPGSGTADLSSYKPTGTSTGKFLTVYIRGSDKTLQILEGEEFALIYSSQNPLQYVEVPAPSQGIPIAAVMLQSGTTRIGWHEIYDLRLAPAMFPQTGSNVGVYDEHAFRGGISNIDFIGEDVTAVVTGSYAYVTITRPNPVDQIGFFALEDGVPLGTGVRLDFGDNLDVTYSGTSVRIDAQGGGGAGGAGGGIVVWDDGVFLVTGTVLDFGDNLDVSASGTVVRIDAQAGGTGASSALTILDDGDNLGTADELDFYHGLDASITGARAFANAHFALIDEIVLSVSSGSVTAMIPEWFHDSYTNIRCVVYARSSEVTDVAGLRIRVGALGGAIDTGNNYARRAVEFGQYGTATEHNLSTNEWWGGRFTVPAASAVAEHYGQHIFEISGGHNTDGFLIMHGSSFDVSTAANWRENRFFGEWRNTAKIGLIQFYLSGSGDFVEGSSFRIYAIR